MTKQAANQELEEIRYFRVKKPPTLKQFLHRKFVGHIMGQVKGENGVNKDSSSGRSAPKSALKARELLKGKKSDDIMKEHPEWVDEYKKEHGDGTGNKEA